MNLAVVLVVAALIALILIARFTISSRLQVRSGNSTESIRSIDLDAFRNLADPAQTAYLRQRLPAAEFRAVQRLRLRAMLDYLQIASRNAAILIVIAQRALSASDPQTARAARQLLESALLLRRNTAFVLLRIRISLAWPDAAPAAGSFLLGYDQLSSAAMLLGRLQHPAVPVRISAG